MKNKKDIQLGEGHVGESMGGPKGGKEANVNIFHFIYVKNIKKGKLFKSK